MRMDDEDYPVSYLFYMLAVIAAMGLIVVGGFFLLFH